MMRRRTFVAGIAAIIAGAVVGEAQQSSRVHRIGFLTPWPLGTRMRVLTPRGRQKHPFVAVPGQHAIA
jgi:hypothetical protein